MFRTRKPAHIGWIDPPPVARRSWIDPSAYAILPLTLLTLHPVAASAQTSAYQQTNLVSDGTVTAQQTDPTLINPWGVAIGQQTPFWVNEAGSGSSVVYNAAGTKEFAVTVPPKGGSTKHGTPTGIVFNAAGSGFSLPGSSSATFIFVTLDGTISGWNASTPNAVVAVDNSASGAVYTGAAMTTGSSGAMLLVADAGKGTIDVFNSQFAPATLSGNFTDPNLPTGFSPYGIHNVGGNIYVTYTPSGGPNSAGQGLGYVDEFGGNGNLLNRVASGGTLNAPWGVALAPAGFGSFGGDLLVGNFGDGAINAYDATSFAFKGQLQDGSGNVIENSGLWELIFGSQGTGDPNTLYFSAGLNGEKGGLFGALSVAQAAAKADFAIAPSASSLSVTAGSSGNLTIDLTQMNAFSGTVTFACSGLPAGATCTFAPSSVDLNTATASTKLTVATAARGTGPGQNPYDTVAGGFASGLPLQAAIVLPGIAGVMFFRRRIRPGMLMLVATVVLLSGGAALVSGCGGYKAPASTTTNPTPQPVNYPMTITATSGTLAHSAQVTLTVD